MTTSYNPDEKPKPPRNHFQDMANREELGIHIYENYRHWNVGERFKRDVFVASREPVTDNPHKNWRERRDPYVGQPDAPLNAKDNGLSLSDDLEFEDMGTPDPQPDATAETNALSAFYAQQVLEVMRDVIGHDFVVLRRVIILNWTLQMLGENEGLMNRASASACGKGVLRAALRDLDDFYLKLDRLEQNGLRPQDVWPLLGTGHYPAVTRHEPTSGYLNQASGPVIKRGE